MAKTLKTETIEIKGMGTPENITIFNCDDPKKPKYHDISRYTNRSVQVIYSYDEDGTVKTDGKIGMKLPSTATEVQMRDFIIDTINNQLAINN